MCNRFRSIGPISPRRCHSEPRLNFEFNPNVTPTKLVPALVVGGSSRNRRNNDHIPVLSFILGAHLRDSNI
jgi:hypothetical protein